MNFSFLFLFLFVFIQFSFRTFLCSESKFRWYAHVSCADLHLASSSLNCPCVHIQRHPIPAFAVPFLPLSFFRCFNIMNRFLFIIFRKYCEHIAFKFCLLFCKLSNFQLKFSPKDPLIRTLSIVSVSPIGGRETGSQ